MLGNLIDPGLEPGVIKRHGGLILIPCRRNVTPIGFHLISRSLHYTSLMDVDL